MEDDTPEVAADRVIRALGGTPPVNRMTREERDNFYNYEAARAALLAQFELREDAGLVVIRWDDLVAIIETLISPDVVYFDDYSGLAIGADR